MSYRPVDNGTPAERKALYDAGIGRLASTLAELRPSVVVALLRRVAEHR